MPEVLLLTKKNMKWSSKWSLLKTMRVELWEGNSKSQMVLFCQKIIPNYLGIFFNWEEQTKKKLTQKHAEKYSNV